MAEFTGLLGDALGYMQDPVRTPQMRMLGGLLSSSLSSLDESDKRYQVLYQKAFADKKNPMRVTDPDALAELTSMTMSGPMGMASAGVTKIYPQAEVLRLAQQRAALPVEQGGLGLLESNTAMDRAKAMGFDLPTYHGTNIPNISSIDVNKSRSDVQYMPGFFTADNPNLAQNYGDIMMPLLQKKGITILDRRAARQSGQEVPMLDTVYDKEKGILVTNNPENIRSRFAAFDPFRRTAATAAAMGVAAPDLLAGEMPEEMKRRQLRGLLAP